jgi:hypothetical protein
VQKVLLSLVFASFGFWVASAHAFLPNAKMPACLDGPDELQIDNAKVLHYKISTPNTFLARGFVQGIVKDVPDVIHGHDHFSISIGPNPTDTLEIIYNIEFGAMPPFKSGDPIVVCGDYITSTAQTGAYPASPDGAIMHWIHFNPGSRANSATHAHGFVMIGADLIGFDLAPAGDWTGRIFKTAEPPGGNGGIQNSGNGGNQNRGNGGNQNRGGNNGQRRGNGQSHAWQPCQSLAECNARNN